MVYNLNDSFEREQFVTRVNFLLDRCGGCVELSEKRQRTMSQNSYIHTAMQYFALQTGIPAREVKDVYFKRVCNADLFVRTRHDDILHCDRETLRSSRELSAEEMSVAIDRFLRWASSEAGIYIPSSDEHIAAMRMQHDVQRNIKQL